MRLALAPDVPPAVRLRLEAIAKEIASRARPVPTHYDGPEFST